MLRSPRAFDLYALTAGGILPLAFAPFNGCPLAFVGPGVLFWVWLNSTPRRALWRGWLFGCALFGVGVSWVVESFQYNHVPLSAAIPLTVLLIAFLALFPAVFGYLALRFGSRDVSVRLLLLFPAGWVLTEYARANVLSGFTWLQLGYSQIDTPLAGLAPVTGVYAMNWVVALSSGLFVWLLCDVRQRWWKALTLVALPWSLAAGLNTRHWSEPAGPDVRVALVQGNVSQALKWRPEAKLPTLKLYLELTRQHWDADLIVWPETALPGLYHTFAEFLQNLELEARANQSDLLIGVPSTEPTPRRYYNSLVALGATRAIYHKRHLVPFGEYLPLATVLGPIVDLLGLPVSNFAAGGPSSRLLTVAGQPVGVSICYEATFGKDIIRALPEATLLVNVSNDAWFGATIAPHQHLQMARMRAKETGRFLARGTNTGISAFIAPDATVVSRSEQFVTTVLTGTITPMSGTPPYARYGDSPAIILIAVAAGLGLVLRPASNAGN